MARNLFREFLSPQVREVASHNGDGISVMPFPTGELSRVRGMVLPWGSRRLFRRVEVKDECLRCRMS